HNHLNTVLWVFVRGVLPAELGRSGFEQRHGLDIAAYVGKISDFLGSECLRNVGTIRLEQRSCGDDFHFGGHFANFQRLIKTRRLVDTDLDFSGGHSLEAGSLDSDLVRTWNQLALEVVAARIRADLKLGPLADVGDGDFGIRHRRTAGVGYGTE